MFKRKNKNIDAALADAERIVSEAEKMNRVERVLKKFNISYTKSVGGDNISFYLIENHYIRYDERKDVEVDYALYDFDDELEIMRVSMYCEEVGERNIIYITYEQFISDYIIGYINEVTN